MRILPQLCAALAIGLLGYWLGTRHASGTRETQVVTVQSSSPTPKPGTKGTSGQTAGYHPGMAAELLADLENVQDTDERDRMLVRRVATLQGDERRLIAEELLAMPKERKNISFALNEVIRQWASDEATVALAWLEALPKSLPQLENQFDNLTVIIACELAKTDGPKALQMLRGIEGGSRRMQKAFRNWVVHNPNEAVAAVATLDDLGQEWAIRGISEGLLNLDPHTAMEISKNLSPKLRSQVQFQVLQNWVGTDTAAAATWLQTVSHEDQLLLNARERGLGRVILYAAKEEPALAIKLLEKLEPSLRSAALPEIADGWASRDFDAAWKWAASLTSPRERTDALVMMGRSAANQPIETILKLAGEITGDAGSQQFLDNCCRGIISSDQPAKFADILRQFSPTQLSDIANEAGLFSHFARSEPETAIQLMKDIPSLSNERNWACVMYVYSQTNSQAAYELAISLPLREELISYPLLEIYKTNRVDALSKAQHLPDEKLRRDITSKLFKQWLESDASGMEKALPSMSGELRKLGQVVAIRRKSQDAPAATAAYLQQLQNSTREEDRQAANSPAVLQQLGSSWGEREPDAAINWIPQVPAGELREEFIQSLANSWTNQDATKASQWVAGLPAGAEKDAAVIGMLGTIGGSDPEAAFAWAAQIGNADKRETGYAEVIQSLHKKSPEAAKTALETAPISEKRKAELREALK